MRVCFDQEKDALVVAMAKELGELEQSKDGIITDSNREVCDAIVDIVLRAGVFTWAVWRGELVVVGTVR